jgi:hypothetical protein
MINERANSISYINTYIDNDATLAVAAATTGRRAVSRTISMPSHPKGGSISIPFQPSIDYHHSSNKIGRYVDR